MNNITISAFQFYNLTAAAQATSQHSSDSILAQAYGREDTTGGRMSMADFSQGHFGIDKDSEIGAFLFRERKATNLPYILQNFDDFETDGVNSQTVFKEALILTLPYLTVRKA